jgi:hypothetical protein
MNRIFRIVAWVTTVSMCVTGCYTSSLIEPVAGDEGELYSQDIEIVVTRDGTKYQFDDVPRPTIVKGSIVGYVKRTQVIIPIAEVSKVYVSKVDAGMTTLAVIAGAVVVLAAIFIISFNNALGDCSKASNTSVGR